MGHVNAPQGPDDLDDEYESFELKDDESDDDDDLDDDFDEDDDDLDDAEEEDVDLVVAAYTEEGNRTAVALSVELANDLDELIVQLRRLPGDAGAVGFVSLAEEMFVIVRVRGQHVQVLLSDGSMAGEWPIARDVADFLGLAEIPEEDEVEPIGDLSILDDAGVSDIDMARWCEDDETGTDQIVLEIADAIGVGPDFRRVVRTEYGD